eukprot:scaffold194843_cov17-Tisochrysis_lutea.AAC.3
MSCAPNNSLTMAVSSLTIVLADDHVLDGFAGASHVHGVGQLLPEYLHESRIAEALRDSNFNPQRGGTSLGLTALLGHLNCGLNTA